jgi:phage baseplate assembly protein W
MASKDYSAYIDGEGTNLTNKKIVKIWRDLDSTFTKHPVTSDVNRIFDVEAIKRSVKHLILTDFGERPFQPWIGSNIRALLFENLDSIVIRNLKDTIEVLLKNFEPRVRLTNLDITGLEEDNNTLRVVINFTLVNFPSGEVYQLETFLHRIK